MKTLILTEQGSVSFMSEFLMKLMGMVLVFLAPIKAILFSIGFLVIADFITGIWAATKRGEKITSNGYRNTVAKSAAYIASILVAHVAQSWLVPDLPIMQIVSAMIGLTEIKSFFENLEHITGMNVWKEVLKKLHGNPKVSKPKRKK